MEPYHVYPQGVIVPRISSRRIVAHTIQRDHCEYSEFTWVIMWAGI